MKLTDIYKQALWELQNGEKYACLAVKRACVTLTGELTAYSSRDAERAVAKLESWFMPAEKLQKLAWATTWLDVEEDQVAAYARLPELRETMLCFMLALAEAGDV